ncbi:helix-turn-helix domain-containing protein [Candidatus Uhrbacteria bacterium]|nr:helix-turn-helix domain-containing protein [Candidatus Uhrbacteria bacterium]
MLSAKYEKKIQAIQLRKEGFSYSEIEKKLRVSRASLSLWLRDILLSPEQKERLFKKQLAGHERAWYLIRQRRIEKTNQIKERAVKEIDRISDRELWLIGIALYWAEGTKEKEHTVSEQVGFSNSDPEMIKVFLIWTQKCLALTCDDIVFSLYIHENAKPRLKVVIDFWARTVNIRTDNIHVYFKKHTVNPYRKNQGDTYMGVLRIRLRRSSELNRKIAGWTQGICQNL